MSIYSTLKKTWQHRIVRFACIGVINTLTDLTLLNIFVFVFNIKVLFANGVSASISVLISYFLNYAIVFRREHPLSLRLFVKFVVVTGLSIIAVQSVIIYGVEHVVTVKAIGNLTHLSTQLNRLIQVNGAKAVAVLGGMAWNFLLYEFVVFKRPKQTSDLDDEGVIPY